MRLSIIALVLLAGSTLFTPHAQAAKPADVAQVIALMYNPNAPNHKKTEGGGVQIVFVMNGKRYTFWHSVDEGKKGNLSVWVRPDGSTGQANIRTFTDRGLDGIVDFGIGGGKDEMKSFNVDRFTTGKVTGEEFRAYWQGLYDQAIIDALRRLETKEERLERQAGQAVDTIDAKQRAHKK